METFIKILIAFSLIFLIWHIGVASVKQTNQIIKSYKNCEPMVDIDGNYQMVCK